jgi:hypothetical protein
MSGNALRGYPGEFAVIGANARQLLSREAIRQPGTGTLLARQQLLEAHRTDLGHRQRGVIVHYVW